MIYSWICHKTKSFDGYMETKIMVPPFPWVWWEEWWVRDLFGGTDSTNFWAIRFDCAFPLFSLWVFVLLTINRNISQTICPIPSKFWMFFMAALESIFTNIFYLLLLFFIFSLSMTVALEIFLLFFLTSSYVILCYSSNPLKSLLLMLDQL